MSCFRVWCFESYLGCPKPEQIAEFLAYGLREWIRVPFAYHPAGGRVYDIIYLRN